MNFLNVSAIAGIKATVEKTLVERWTINQRKNTNAGTGPRSVLSARYTDIPGRSSVDVDRSAHENVIGGSTREQETIILTLEVIRSGITARDQAVCVAGIFAGRSFEVVRELTTSHKTFCRRYLCKAE